MGYFEGIKVPVFEDLKELIDSGESHRVNKTIILNGGMIKIPNLNNVICDFIDSGESHRVNKTLFQSGECIKLMNHVHFRKR